MLLCSSAAMAHYILDYPQSRGFDDDKEPTAPCGGFDTVGNRTQFPLSNGFLEIESFHVKADIKINVAYGNAPSAADFTTAAATPASSISINHPGLACLPLDLSSFNGAANNTNATIQVVYNGGDSPLYQCADVVLVTSAPAFNQSMCVNNSNSSPSPSTSGSGTSPTNTSEAGAALSAKGIFTAAVAVLLTAALAL
ncbi:hypothetical protein BC939DRAFT_398159 [Gamsiella multidivaricata]|uniref:uncharacterized protein n=1 Tax=Gamsiella multidivaricata TaxID=101098 RepID=UPI00221F18AC|nr:uncharacterized protein BC939DRAFT_398159 [Gamsiella multidivaricata]KAI7822160.1 hypothetical protein BC939DRAFT_398159 [Gamsiella multidivaricata]